MSPHPQHSHQHALLFYPCLSLNCQVEGSSQQLCLISSDMCVSSAYFPLVFQSSWAPVLQSSSTLKVSLAHFMSSYQYSIELSNLGALLAGLPPTDPPKVYHVSDWLAYQQLRMQRQTSTTEFPNLFGSVR